MVTPLMVFAADFRTPFKRVVSRGETACVCKAGRVQPKTGGAAYVA